MVERTPLQLQPQPILGLRSHWLKSFGGHCSGAVHGSTQWYLEDPGGGMGNPAVSEKAPDLRVYMLAASLRTRALDPLDSSLHSCALMMLGRLAA